MEKRRHVNRTHGLSRTPIYVIWVGMVARCMNPKNLSYSFYGARGIRVCAEWVGPGGFAEFFKHVGPRPSSKHQIDRIDNEGHYEPGNVRWVLPTTQSRNRRSNRLIEYQGEVLPLVAWAERTGLKRSTIAGRLKKGRSVGQALGVDPHPNDRVQGHGALDEGS